MVCNFKGISLIQGGSGRQSRSSSLSVPAPLSSCSLSVSSSSLNNSSLPPEPFTPSLVRSTTPASSRSNVTTPHGSPRSGKDNAKSKSASEPEREREMFRWFFITHFLFKLITIFKIGFQNPLQMEL